MHYLHQKNMFTYKWVEKLMAIIFLRYKHIHVGALNGNSLQRVMMRRHNLKSHKASRLGNVAERSKNS